ncbi:MlaD family protein [Gordonia sp. CPCC 205333]|uniref:MlaD family protein n=1 Tax=Gordonia sp. CPCC 205333 TaxID=3140790 RepID=UPI003AF3F8C0
MSTKSGRALSPTTIRLRGIALLLVMICVGIVLSMYATGEFQNKFRVTVNASTIGEGLTTGADVKLNGLSIGKVRRIDTVGYGEQRIELELEPNQVVHLTDHVRARFASSNLFGATAIELIKTPGGAPLRDGATLSIGRDSTQVTVSDVFSRAGKLAATIGDPEVIGLLRLFVTNARGIGKSLVAFLNAGRMLRDNQIGPIRKYLATGAEISGAAESMVPLLVAGVVDLLEQAKFLGTERNRARTKRAIAGLNDKLLYPLGDLFRTHNGQFSKIAATALDLVIPVAVSIGSIAPAVDRIPELIANIRAAFPNVAGRPQLQLRIIATNFPQVTRSVGPNKVAGR